MITAAQVFARAYMQHNNQWVLSAAYNGRSSTVQNKFDYWMLRYRLEAEWNDSKGKLWAYYKGGFLFRIFLDDKQSIEAPSKWIQWVNGLENEEAIDLGFIQFMGFFQIYQHDFQKNLVYDWMYIYDTSPRLDESVEFALAWHTPLADLLAGKLITWEEFNKIETVWKHTDEFSEDVPIWVVLLAHAYRDLGLEVDYYTQTNLLKASHHCGLLDVSKAEVIVTAARDMQLRDWKEKDVEGKQRGSSRHRVQLRSTPLFTRTWKTLLAEHPTDFFTKHHIDPIVIKKEENYR